MAVLLVSAVGAAVGSSLGLGIAALGLSGAAVGWTIGSVIGNALFGPENKSEGPRLGDLRVTGTEYGQPIPWISGSPRISGQIIWASNKRETATTTEVGKGGGGSEVTNYTYDVDLLYLLSENQISGVSRVWKDGELVYNGNTKEGTWSRITVYYGDNFQLPDPTYEAAVGTTNAPAYRTRGCIFIEGLQLGSNGIIPNLTFEISTSIGNFIEILPNVFQSMNTGVIWSDSVSPVANGSSVVTSGNSLVATGDGNMRNNASVRPGISAILWSNPTMTSKAMLQVFNGLFVNYETTLTSVTPSNITLQGSWQKIFWLTGSTLEVGFSLFVGNNIIQIGAFTDSVSNSFPLLTIQANEVVKLRLHKTDTEKFIFYINDANYTSAIGQSFDTNSLYVGLQTVAVSSAFASEITWRGPVSVYSTRRSTFYTDTIPPTQPNIPNLLLLSTFNGDILDKSGQNVPVSSSAGLTFGNGGVILGPTQSITYNSETTLLRRLDGLDYSLEFNLSIYGNQGTAFLASDVLYWRYARDNYEFYVSLYFGRYYVTWKLINSTVQGGAYLTDSVVFNTGFKNLLFVYPKTGSMLCYVDGELKATLNVPAPSFGSSNGVVRLLGYFPTSNGINLLVNHSSVRVARSILTPTNVDDFDSLYTGITYNYEGIGAVLNTLSDRANIPFADRFVDQSLNDPVRGYVISQVSTTRSSMEQLQVAYLFDVHSSDKLYFKPKNTDSIVTIPWSDLGLTESNSFDEPFVLNSANELEIPGQISLSFNNTNSDYQTSTEFSDRILSEQKSISNIGIPVGLTPTEAKKIANAIMIDQISSTLGTSIRVPIKYSFVEPNDVITVMNEDDTRSYRFKVVSKKDSNGYLDLECVISENTVIEYEPITDDQDQNTTTLIDIANTAWQEMDIPLLRDIDDDYGYYVAMKSNGTATSSWPGAVFLRSWDNNQFFQEGLAFNQATFGVCTTTLGNFTEGNVFDEYNTVTVNVGLGELTSVTRDALFADENLNNALVGNELIRFRDAVLVLPGIYTLSGLLRGMKGTEQYISTHQSDERFVLLNSTGTIRVLDDLSKINVDSHIKAVTSGLLISSVTSEQFTNTGVSLKPLSPVNLRIIKDDQTGDFNITWIRRTRRSLTYFGANGGNIPLGEATEAYRLKFYDGATLVRTVETNAPSFVYTASMQTSDGFTTGETFTVDVVQLSNRIGEGFKTTGQGTL